MSKLLVIFGATGQQGGSLINTVLTDPNLSKQYKIRAVTRDTSKPAAQTLKSKGVELAQADADDEASLQQALKQAHTVFIVTITPDGAGAKEIEIKQGKQIADAAVAANAQYLIFSSTPAAKKISGKDVDIFDAKADIEDYIRGLKVKSAFYHPGFFMQNFHGSSHGNSQPRPTEEPGVYRIAQIPANETRLPLLEVAADTGKFIAPILAHPDKYEGKVFCGATKLYSYDEAAQAISNATGKKVIYQSLPSDVFRTFLPPDAAGPAVQMLEFFRDWGYFGPQSQEQVNWSVAQVPQGSLTTFEDFLKKNPIDLE